jgi:hypothetical protein
MFAAKQVHPIRAQTKPYVPYFIGKRPLITMINSSPLGAISRVPQLSIFTRSFACHLISFVVFAVANKHFKERNDREIPHHLRGRSFLVASLHHGIIANFVS